MDPDDTLQPKDKNYFMDKFQVNKYKKNLPASLVMQLNCLGLFVKL